MMHRFIRGVFRAPILIVAVLIVLVAGGGFALTQAGGLPFGLTAPTGPTGVSFSLPGPKRAPDATDKYLKASQTGDADQLWSTLSDEAVDRYRARGVGRQEMRQRLATSLQRGVKIEQINYIGGQALPDGTSMQFYLVGSRGPDTKADLEFVTYIFTLDRTGKILKVQ